MDVTEFTLAPGSCSYLDAVADRCFDKITSTELAANVLVVTAALVAVNSAVIAIWNAPGIVRGIASLACSAADGVSQITSDSYNYLSGVFTSGPKADVVEISAQDYVEKFHNA